MIQDKHQSGLTMIELLISLAIAGLLLAAMVMAFTGQSRIYNTQQEISTLQEDMWAALQLMSRDIREAGYDRTGTGLFGIVTATRAQFQATQDINEDGATGGPNENIRYALTPTATGNALGREENGGGLQPLVDNITHLAFEYETVTTSASAPWVWNWTDTPGDVTAIRVVKICMQGRTPRETSTATDTSSFHPPFTSFVEDWTPAAPGKHQYRTMCIEVKCRNFND